MFFKNNYVTTDWTLISKIKSGSAREPVLRSLEKPITPTKLSQALKIEKSQISRALKFLEQNDLATCLTPKVRKHKLFQRTEKGTKLLEEIDKLP